MSFSNDHFFSNGLPSNCQTFMCLNPVHSHDTTISVDRHRLDGSELNSDADMAPGCAIIQFQARHIGFFFQHYHIGIALVFKQFHDMFNGFSEFSVLLSAFQNGTRLVPCLNLLFDWHFAIASAWGPCRTTQHLSISTIDI